MAITTADREALRFELQDLLTCWIEDQAEALGNDTRADRLTDLEQNELFAQVLTDAARNLRI